VRRKDRRHDPPPLGSGFSDLGGTNESALHWDIVKDLRRGGRIELDGRIVQENGIWL
jgi:aminopeptidase